MLKDMHLNFEQKMHVVMIFRVVQSVHGLAALALAVPVIFHWYTPPDDEDRMPDWASTGLDWKGRIQMAAFCFFEVSAVQPCKESPGRTSTLVTLIPSDMDPEHMFYKGVRLSGTHFEGAEVHVILCPCHDCAPHG